MAEDCFKLLGLPPRAYLDEEALQSAYLQATRSAHPDQTGGDGDLSAELNAAQETLRSPVTRLKHLIEKHSQTAWRAIPLEADLMSLFEKLGPLLQRSISFTTLKQAATTALARALLSNEEMQLREALEALNEDIEQQWRQLEAQLPIYDTLLQNADSGVWSDLQAIQAKFAYLTKWRTQIREQLLHLML
jgi:curved DNA-binding protein CbpA